MDAKEIGRKRELIAKFMGIKPTMKPRIKLEWEKSLLVDVNAYRYDSSWNDLMPVVRKIVELCIEDGSTGTGELFTSDYYTSILETVPLGVIDDAFKVVAEFIEWYNTLAK